MHYNHCFAESVSSELKWWMLRHHQQIICVQRMRFRRGPFLLNRLTDDENKIPEFISFLLLFILSIDITTLIQNIQIVYFIFFSPLLWNLYIFQFLSLNHVYFNVTLMFVFSIFHWKEKKIMEFLYILNEKKGFTKNR